MATLDITTNASNVQEFTKTIQITKQSNTTLRFNTQGNYVDKDVLLTLNVRGVSGSIGGSATAGKATAALTNVNSMATTTDLSGTAGADYWAVKATASGTAGSYTPKYNVTTSGWINGTVTANAAQTVTVNSDTTGQTIYIPKATLKWNGDKVLVNSAGYLPVDDTKPLLTMDSALIDSTGSVSTAPSVTIGGETNMQTASSGTYYFTRTGTISNGVVQTKWKNTRAGYAALNTSGTNGDAITVAPTTTPDDIVYIPTLSLNFAGGGLTGSGMTTSLGSGFVTDTADNYANGLTIQSKYNVGRAQVTYTNTKGGYTPAHTSAQNASSAVAASDKMGTKYYIKGVNLVKPSSGTTKFDITVPNGDSTITFQFQVDSSGNVSVLGPD